MNAYQYRRVMCYVANMPI